MKSFSRASVETMTVVFVIAIILNTEQVSGDSEATASQQQAQADSYGSYFSQARKFFDSGTQKAHPEAQSFRTSTNSVTSDEQRSMLMLRDSIGKATDLINEYRQNGLSSLPNLPNLPGVNTIMSIPDKLLRAELSMLQDEIRMAQEMMQNPIAATMNIPRDLATMLVRIAEQLEQ